MPHLWLSLDPVQQSLLLLVAATALLYVGNRLLWAAVPAAGLWRGVAMAGPVVAMAAVETVRSPGGGVAVLIGSAVLAVTLGLGVSTLDDAGPPSDSLRPDHIDDPSLAALRTLLPLAATVCLAGFRGELPWAIGGAIAVVGLLALWTASGERQRPATPTHPFAAVILMVTRGLPALIALGVGLALLLWATARFRHSVGNAPLTPVVVLLTVPPLTLALIGLLAAEPRRVGHAMTRETVVGFVLACLGVGLPLAVAVGRGWPTLAGVAGIGRVLPDAAAATQPDFVPVTMPLSTWRIDSALLLVVALLLMPVGTGRLRLGRTEGFLLIGLYLAYAAVATRTGGLAG